MSDTSRSLATLATLLADNTTKDISPQDLRDMLASLTPPYGSFHIHPDIDPPVETPIAVTGVYEKAEVYGAAPGTLRDFTVGTDGRLTFTGVADRHFHIAATLNLTCGVPNQIVGACIAKNGVAIDESQTRVVITAGSSIVTMALHYDLMLTTNDYIEVWLANHSTGNGLTVEYFYFFAMGMIM